MNCYVYLKKTDPATYNNKAMHDLAYEMLDEILVEKYNINLNSCEIVTNEHGKPLFSNPALPFFNISHTRGAVLVCVCDCNIGCDVEHERKLSDAMIKHVFNEQELKIEKGPKLLLWTFKEAYLKMIGTGIFNKSHKLDEIYPNMVKQGTLLTCNNFSYYQFINENIYGTICMDTSLPVSMVIIA